MSSCLFALLIRIHSVCFCLSTCSCPINVAVNVTVDVGCVAAFIAGCAEVACCTSVSGTYIRLELILNLCQLRCRSRCVATQVAACVAACVALQLLLPLALRYCLRCRLRCRSRCVTTRVAACVVARVVALVALPLTLRCRQLFVLLSRFDFPPKEVSDKVNSFLFFQFAKGCWNSCKVLLGLFCFDDHFEKIKLMVCIVVVACSEVRTKVNL